MLAAVPAMHDFAMSLCRRPDRVDDLVQEALLRAITRPEFASLSRR
jgi:DNA-directed RNA polymerase specialized sigma24 family protein